MPPILSEKDMFMAKFCDEQAGMVGTVEENPAKKCGLSEDLGMSGS